MPAVAGGISPAVIALVIRRRAKPWYFGIVSMPTTLGISRARQNPDSHRITPGTDHKAAPGDNPIRTPDKQDNMQPTRALRRMHLDRPELAICAI